MNTLTARPWYREPWPWILMAGPFLVIVAGIVTVWLAIRSNDGLVADDYYKQGLAVSQTLRRDSAARELGYRAVASRDDARGTIDLALTARGGTPLPREVSLRLSHPTRAGLDRTIRMTAGAEGRFTAPMPELAAGRWHVIVEEAGGQWRLTGTWDAAHERSITLGD